MECLFLVDPFVRIFSTSQWVTWLVHISLMQRIIITTLAVELNQVLGIASFFRIWKFKRPLLWNGTTVFARAETILSESNPELNFEKFLYMNVTCTQTYVDISHINSPLKFCNQIFVISFMRATCSGSFEEGRSAILSTDMQFLSSLPQLDGKQ